MPVQISCHETGIVVTCRDRVTTAELIDARTKLLSDIGQLTSVAFLLFDQAAAKLGDLSTVDLHDLARLDEALSRHTPNGTIVAVVVGRDVDYGLARMWQTFVDGNGWETMVFRSREQAEQWIKTKTAERFKINVAEFPDVKEQF